MSKAVAQAVFRPLQLFMKYLCQDVMMSNAQIGSFQKR